LGNIVDGKNPGAVMTAKSRVEMSLFCCFAFNGYHWHLNGPRSTQINGLLIILFRHRAIGLKPLADRIKTLIV